MARPPLQAERQSRSPGRPRPMRVAAKCGACFVGLLGIVAQATTFVARLAFIRILPATQSAWDSFRGSLGFDRFVRRKIELDARSVGVEKEDLPHARARLLPADVLDVVGGELGERCRQAAGGERDVIDHAGLEGVAAAPADEVQYRAAFRVKPCTGKIEVGALARDETQ